MNLNIKEILEELYKLDPALRSEEAELKDIIAKLIEKKPDAEADQDFKERLKRELLEQADQKKKRAGFFVVHRKAIVSAAGIAAALIVILTFAVRPGLISGIMSPDKMMASEMINLSELPTVQQDDTTETKEKETQAEPLADIQTDPELQEIQTKAVPQKDSILSAPPSEPGFQAEPAPAAPSMAGALSQESPLLQKRSMEKTLSSEDEAFAEDEGGLIIDLSNEEYGEIVENGFIKTSVQPLSTFSVDVDTASYSNVRRFLNSGTLPNPDAVRIEELINYFTYDYKQPEGIAPFSITTELSRSPWSGDNLLLHIGLQGYEVPAAEMPPTNLVFLLDSSGSMQDENKLPLLKDSLSLLIDTLRPEDRLSIVAYAGSAGLVLPPTAGNQKAAILSAIDRIEAGGSTAGGDGIDLAYRTAAENFFDDGNNRVILATDGDFNVGQSSEEELKTMIEARRDQGISLTVLGLGMGNYKDARMEALADNGNGNYAYIDTLNEANKVLITELSSTLLTIAKDVKIQIDFNEQIVDSYRLIGYENRMMAAEDFSNDKKDAGEIGAGHSVTALYEIIPADTKGQTGNLAEIRFRYKNPDEDQSQLIVSEISDDIVSFSDTSDNFRFSAAVAEWGMLLRNSTFSPESDMNRVIVQAENSRGQDKYGYRAEFIGLLKKTAELLE